MRGPCNDRLLMNIVAMLSSCINPTCEPHGINSGPKPQLEKSYNHMTETSCTRHDDPCRELPQHIWAAWEPLEGKRLPWFAGGGGSTRRIGSASSAQASRCPLRLFLGSHLSADLHTHLQPLCAAGPRPDGRGGFHLARAVWCAHRAPEQLPLGHQRLRGGRCFCAAARKVQQIMPSHVL